MSDQDGNVERRLTDFCVRRVATVLPPAETERLRDYMLSLWALGQHPPFAGGGLNWAKIAANTQIQLDHLRAASPVLGPGFDVLRRAIATQRKASDPKPCRPDVGTRAPVVAVGNTRPRRRPGAAPRPVEEFPEPVTTIWQDCESFSEALNLHMNRHGDTIWRLYRAVVREGDLTDRKTFSFWRRGIKAPRTVGSLEILKRIERRYRLPEGYFRSKLPHPARASSGFSSLNHVSAAEMRRLAWHLPDDFDARPLAERNEILSWVRNTIINGSTDYRRFQAIAVKSRYALRFPREAKPGLIRRRHQALDEDSVEDGVSASDPELAPGKKLAPPALIAEMDDLLSFKTATLTRIGYQRNGVWGPETAGQRLEHLGLLFGALTASPHGPVRGKGIPKQSLCLGLLAFPAVWDWYVQWREQRRGFYTVWEVDMLRLALGLVRNETGWIRQNPALAVRVRPIPGLISAADINSAQADWDGWCNAFYKHGSARAREIERVARVHRDPFEPILPILESDNPVGEYRKITEEILRLMPDGRLYPTSAAESVRAFLMLRFGLHLGLRQKNLRQLLFCPRGQAPRSERQLAEMRCGELRWSDRDHAWEVLIPAVAFKNAHSSYFAGKPFRLMLPDFGGLYAYMDTYIQRHRRRLLRGAADPGTFFVKTVRSTSRNAAFDQTTFYESWRLTIQRFGTYNPYTGRGVIRGLLPHGPHNVRDVLATHILKKTGSYEQASYAIQDTPDMVAKHYGRFLPQHKAELAAKTLNLAWAA